MPIPSHHFRIIGGQWRRRQFPIPPHKAIRATSDRIRETLFNWLMDEIEGAVCVDAFAGSGALGLEALSRGAEQVYFIDPLIEVQQHLKKTLETLHSSKGIVLGGKSPDAFSHITQSFNLVFLDPPFRQSYVLNLLNFLEQNPLFITGGLVYVEAEKSLDLEEQLSENWSILKASGTKTLDYYLLSKSKCL